MTPASASDIVPNGTATAITTGTEKATVLVLTAKSGNGADMRFGDSNIGSGRGAILPKGVPVVLPRVTIGEGQYPLAQIYVYGAAGTDAVSVSWF